MPGTDLERFLAKVNRIPGGCWVWTGATAGRGYGVFSVKRDGRWRMTYAHRWSYEHHHGPIPTGLLVMHSCDTPPCVRPSHLSVGTQAQNLAEMDARGRRVTPDRRGERNGNVRLTDDEVASIRALYAAGGVSQTALGARFGVSQNHISRLVRGTRRHSSTT